MIAPQAQPFRSIFPPALFLEYLSALCAMSLDGTLPWERFRTSVASFSPEHQHRAGFVLDDLAALGHAERSVDRARWTICPPALVGLPDGRAAVLTGARSRALIGRLADAAARAGLGCDAIAVSPDGRFIETVKVTSAHEQQLAEVADMLGIKWLPDAARRLAACLPSIGALVDAAPAALIDDEPGLDRLDDTKQAIESRGWIWRPVELPSAPGVYRRVEPGRVTHWLRREHDAQRCDRAIAVYGRLQALLEHDEGSRVVIVHREALPPDLHRRALVLCSGRLPSAYNRTRVAFSNVPSDIARRAIHSLSIGTAQ